MTDYSTPLAARPVVRVIFGNLTDYSICELPVRLADTRRSRMVRLARRYESNLDESTVRVFRAGQEQELEAYAAALLAR